MVSTTKLNFSVSLLSNNLACSPSGWLASIHSPGNTGAGRLVLQSKGNNLDGPEVIQGASVRYLTLRDGSVLLCICSGSGTQIFTEDASALLFYMPVDAKMGQADEVKQHRGTCVVTFPETQHIVVGTNAGGIAVIHALDQFQALFECPPASAAAEVADVCYSTAANVVISAHENGELRVWAPALNGHYVNGLVMPPVGEAPVRVASLGSRIVVAYADGHIRLFDATTLELQAQITAHARCLNAMDVKEEFGQIASVAEDTVLNVYLVDPATGHVDLQHSSHVVGMLLTGVALTPEGGAVVAAYESSELYHVQLW